MPSEERVVDASARLLRRLYHSRGKWVSVQALEHAMYGDSAGGGPENSRVTIRIFVSRLRKRYGRDVIETATRLGCYRIPEAINTERIPGLVADDRMLCEGVS